MGIHVTTNDSLILMIGSHKSMVDGCRFIVNSEIETIKPQTVVCFLLQTITFLVPTTALSHSHAQIWEKDVGSLHQEDRVTLNNLKIDLPNPLISSAKSSNSVISLTCAHFSPASI